MTAIARRASDPSAILGGGGTVTGDAARQHRARAKKWGAVASPPWDPSVTDYWLTEGCLACSSSVIGALVEPWKLLDSGGSYPHEDTTNATMPMDRRWIIRFI